MKAKSVKQIVEVSKDVETEVMRVHNLFWESYARRDIDLRFSLCSEDVTFIGSGLHERALNKTEYKNINKEGVKQFPNPFQIEFLWTNLTMLNENVACIESEVVWSQLINDEMFKELLRNTTLLKSDNNKWLVTHVHGSVPDYRLKDGDYMTNEQTIIRNRELERQVFERTQDLNKTLEELELKNRELEIEASLERVRAVALGMNKSDDLLSICEVSFKEFKKLGFDNIRNALIHIQYDKQKYFMDYDFSDLTGGAITKIEYGSHPVVEDYLKQIRSAKDAFYKGVIKEDQLEEWKNFRRNSGQIDDPRLDKATALYYYFFSIGIGDIGISTLEPINESQIKILKRFRNVFDLAYRRYTDITQAEAQAKEAQIELALERVRARTMAMQKSDELKEVIRVVYLQFVNLKINVDHAGFVVDYTPKGDWHFWIADEQDIPSKITHPYFESVWANQFNEAKEKGTDFFATNLNFEEKNKFYNELLSYVPGLPEASKDFYLSCPGLAATTVLFDNVSLYIENFSGIPYTDEENNMLMRFGKVFQQTYTRFLDLQKAEAQNKIIQTENERKTKELEEARQLQLALLPKSIPEIPNLDIAVYMKTATEVGGDYYDFKVQENGVLNIGIGDATGHGLQAGTMITLMKGFFTSDVAKFNPQKFLENCNGIIRDIKLGRILMSFSHLRFENNRLLISSAGMPPIYYYHKKNNRTEEISIQGLPLGAMRNASYKLVEKEINSGDTILLLTDGLPEQMNSHKVIFDYSRVLKYFDEIAENAPNDIINRLVQKADEWMDGQKQNDDITFVVIRAI